MDFTKIDVKNYFENIAEERGFVLNGDTERIEKIVRLMTKNIEDTDKPFCPCKMKNRPPVDNIDPLCPCDELDDEVANDGHCRCRVFYKK